MINIPFKLVKILDTIRIPPHRFGEPFKEVVEDILRNGYEYRGYKEGEYEGKLDKDLGIIVAITKVIEIGEGRILPGDGAIYCDVVFEALIFKPEVNEIIEGEVTEVREFGFFVNLGGIEGFVHISQIMDDYISYDRKNSRLIGKQTKRFISVGDIVRARVVTVSINPDNIRETKIGLTMRQPGLGKIEWLREEKKDERGKKK